MCVCVCVCMYWVTVSNVFSTVGPSQKTWKSGQGSTLHGGIRCEVAAGVCLRSAISLSGEASLFLAFRGLHFIPYLRLLYKPQSLTDYPLQFQAGLEFLFSSISRTSRPWNSSLSFFLLWVPFLVSVLDRTSLNTLPLTHDACQQLQ